MLKKLSATVLVASICLLSLNSFAASTPTKCGDGTADRNYPLLDWETITTYKVKSNYTTVNAILCAGVDRANKSISRVHYRDNVGVRIESTMEELKKRDVAFLRHSDLPAAARVITRKRDPLTIRVVSDTSFFGKRIYAISLKFVRNMAIGFNKIDIREMKLNVSIDKKANGRLIAYITKIENARTRFDFVTLQLEGNLTISTLSFFDGHNLQKTYIAKNLGKVR